MQQTEIDAITNAVIARIPGSREAIAAEERKRRAPLIDRRKKILVDLAGLSAIEATPEQIAPIDRRIETLQKELAVAYAKRADLVDAYGIAWRRAADELGRVERELREAAWPKFEWLLVRCSDTLSFARVPVDRVPIHSDVMSRFGLMSDMEAGLRKLIAGWRTKNEPLLMQGDGLRRSFDDSIQRARLTALDEAEAYLIVIEAFQPIEAFFIDARAGVATPLRLAAA